MISPDKLALAALALGLLTATQAHADPCEAIQERGPKPAWIHKGAEFSGAVRYLGDGDSICVGKTTDPREWIEVRLADYFAPELHEPGGEAAKATLARIALGKQADCTVGGGNNGRLVSYDRVIAVCRIGGVSLGDLMRKAGVVEGGRGRK